MVVKHDAFSKFYFNFVFTDVVLGRNVPKFTDKIRVVKVAAAKIKRNSQRWKFSGFFQFIPAVKEYAYFLEYEFVNFFNESVVSV